jgi:hypothetical protein
MSDQTICLGGACGGCGLCQSRRAENRPSGWLPRMDPQAVERMLGPDPEPEAG